MHNFDIFYHSITVHLAHVCNKTNKSSISLIFKDGINLLYLPLHT